MDIDHTFDVPDTPIRPATRGVDGRRSRAIHPSSFPSHSEEQNLLEGTKGRPVVIDSGSRGRPVCPQKSASSFTNDHLFRRRIFENVNFRSQDSIHARQLQSVRPPRISNTSSSSLDDHFVDEKEGNLHRPVTGKTSSSGMQKDIQVEFPKQSGLSNGTSSHGMGKFLNASCDSSKETDNLNEVDSSIEHREVVGFVGNVRTEPAKGNSVSVYPISPPKVNRQKQLVRNGCISPNNIAQGKQLAKKNINDPEDEAHNNYGTVALSSPPNSIDIRNLVADDNDSYTRKGKGILSYPNSFKGHDVKIKSLHGSEKAVENGDSIIHAGKSIEELGGWRRTGNRTRGIYISSSAGGEQHLGREMDGSRYPRQQQNNRLEIREDGGKSFLVDNGHPEVQDLTSPEHVCPQPLTGSMPYHRVQFEQLNGSHSMVDSLIKRQRQGSTSSSCGESSALAPNDPEIVCLDSPVEAAHQKSTSRRETFHRIFNVDEVSPPLRHNAQDEDARAMQVEADERLARELQVQLYNEFPAFGIGEIVEHISLALEQQDDSNHDIFQRGSSRTNFTRQSQSSSSNVLRRGSVSREAAARRMARFRSRLDGQPRAVLPSRRTSIFPADMDVDLRMHILGTLEEFNDIRVRSGFLQMEHDFNENDYEMLLALDDNNDQHLGASAHHINNLPQSVIQTDNFEETCTICLEIPTVGDTIRHLPCLHKFHKDCIDEWLRRRTSCPVCKSSIT